MIIISKLNDCNTLAPPLVANTESGGDVLKFYNVLCDSLEDSKKKKYVDFLTAKSYAHKTLPVNESNALGIAKEIAMKEETRLRDFLEGN